MRKMAVAVLILCVILTGHYIEVKSIEKICDSVPEELTQIEKSLRQGDLEKSRKEFKSFLKSWKKNEEILDVFTTHEGVEEINISFIHLERYVDRGDADSASIVIREIEERLTRIQKRSKIHFTNIL